MYIITGTPFTSFTLESSCERNESVHSLSLPVYLAEGTSSRIRTLAFARARQTNWLLAFRLFFFFFGRTVDLFNYLERSYSMRLSFFRFLDASS